MAEQPQVQTGQGGSEKSITIKLSEDARPVGLMPPSFPEDYVAGSVAPFFLAGSYVGETPSLPMIDLAFTKEGACPVQWWGMLYEGWVPNPDEEGTTVFLRGYEKRGPNNERKKIYMTATTPDLIDTKYRGKIQRFYERFLADANAGTPLMQHYFDNYYDLYWELHVGATGTRFPALLSRWRRPGAPRSEQQGRDAGRLIDARIRGKAAPRPFCYADDGSRAVVGKGFTGQHRRALGARVLSRMTTREKGAHDGNEEGHARRGTRKGHMHTDHRSVP